MNLRVTSSPIVSAVALAAVVATASAVTPGVAVAAPAATWTAVGGDVLTPSLVDHLAEVGAAKPVRVMVQAGGDIGAAENAARAAGLLPEASLDKVGIAVAIGTPAQVEALGEFAGVTRVDWADEVLEAFSETSHKATRAEQVHDGAVDVDGDGALDGFDGSGFSVAVVDSGTDGTHPMFADENGDSRVKKNIKIVCSDALPILAGIFVEDPYASAASCAVDATAVNDTDTASLGGHGTHVTGIAAGGIVTDAAGRELRGGAPGADIVAVSTGAAVSVYGGTLGMYWVLENHADPCGDGSCAPVVAVNNSWGPAGGGDFSADAPQVLVQRALVEEGVTVVWAAGNDGGDGTTTMTNPYSVDPTPGVLSVANYYDADTGSRDNALDASSSRGQAGAPATYPDVSAPGTNITSACRPYLPICATGLDTADPDYNTITGTSMAAPHVAGYTAVLQQIAVETTGRRLSPAAIEDLFVNSAHQFGSRTYEADPRNADSTTGTSFDAGHGLVDMVAAVELLTGLDAAPTTGESCPVDGRFSDPEGDATGALGVEAGGPNAAGLDVTEGWFASDPASGDVTLHWRVSDLAETPGGPEGTGEYFDANFSLGGGGYYLGATRTAEDGETFVLGRFGEAGRETLSSELTGAFDPATDEISVTLPAALWTELGLPGSIRAGEEIAGVSIVGRRSLVLVVPDADTATSGCAYTIGAEDEPVNAGPVVTSTSVTSGKGAIRAGAPLTFTAAATDADADPLEYTWRFGDGSSASGAVVRHRYAAAGTYTARVAVTDGVETVRKRLEVVVKGKRGKRR